MGQKLYEKPDFGGREEPSLKKKKTIFGYHQRVPGCFDPENIELTDQKISLSHTVPLFLTFLDAINSYVVRSEK